MKSVAKIRSLPAMPSASAMQASLPLWMMAPRRRSSTETLLWMAANMVGPPEGAPPLRQAFSLMRYSSVSLTSPFLRALNTTSAVISFIMLEGARSSSAFFSNSTLPLEASIRIAVERVVVFLGALHAVVGGVDRPATSDGQHQRGGNQMTRAAPRPPKVAQK